ncbi:hypothetical protein GQ53DRAFT_883776 [Thozetella sp. PMI_491]|nr:hypothetical protein GQ53DRAFT_883776 [Thozetella sp. PMI_491]
MLNKTRQKRIRKGLHTSLPDEGTPELELWQLNRDDSPFLRLPPEIRNRIYELLLSVGQINVHYVPWVHKSKTQSTKGGFGCQLLRREQNPFTPKRDGQPGAGAGRIRGLTLLSGVCRQLYHETVLLPYQLNAWSFENNYVMERFVLKERRLSRFQRRAIHTLYVKDGLNPAMEKFFGGLKVLLLGDGTRLVKTPASDPDGSARTKYTWKNSAS